MFETIGAAADLIAADLTRLKRRFDPLLDGPAPLDDAAAEELRLFARIHDLDDQAPPSVLWRTLRTRLEDLAPPDRQIQTHGWRTPDGLAA